MAVERPSGTEENLGSLRGCLVEGNPEQRKRERRVRRRALLASVLVQGTALIALLLIPLFAKPAKLVQAYMPVPVYSHAGPKPTHPEVEQPHVRPPRNVCRFCPPLGIPSTIVTHDAAPPDTDTASVPIPGEGLSFTGQIPLSAPSKVVPPIETHVERPHVVHVTHIDPAMLIHRVEPVYPTLARQIGRAGRVELRAVIATDGTIQALQVVSGDPMFYQSAMEAVRQWRYRPTVLNGQPVEIDTFITVIYNVNAQR